MEVPAVIKIVVVFVSVLIVTRCKVPLGVSLALGGVALNLWAGIGPRETVINFLRALKHAELWLMLGVTALIIELARYLTQPRNASEIVTATRRWGGRHGRAASLIALPAMIGLIPMAAGALFSAPFVEHAGAKLNGASAWKTAVNYWFRHVWEYWWPLYPGVIVAMSVFQMDAPQFILTQFFYTPVALAAGYFFLIRPHVAVLAEEVAVDRGNSRRAFFLMSPLAIVVVSLFVLTPLLRRLIPGGAEEHYKLLSLLLGLVAGLAVAFGDDLRHGEFRMFSTLWQAKSLDVLASLTGVLLFKFMLGKSGLLPAAGRELMASGIPPALAVAALPFLAGTVTGIAIGFTGASFPLVFGLMAAEGSGLTPRATLVLAYGFGHAGMMLSPVHLCLLVSRDYFRSSLPAVYREIAPCVMIALGYSIAGYVILSMFGL
ncbi:MAG: DUF401 family protein [Kiritimatiellae bacterium]|nr:DUF401 family protein [Kiritimatiellia bacterium]